MKSGLFKIVAISSIFLFLFSSCLKNEEEPVPVYGMKDYVGQWKGTFPTNSVDNPLASEWKMSIISYANNTVLTGYLNTSDGILILDNELFFGGVYSFAIRNNSFNDPNCQLWDAGGSAYLLHINNIGISYGGTFCGTHPVNVSGTMTRTSLQPDSTIFLTMASVGRRLFYTATDSTGVSYDYSTEYKRELSNGLWQILTERDDMPYIVSSYRFITPVEWGNLPPNDSTPSHQQTHFRIDARVGTTYVSATAADSTIVTVKSLGEMVTVPAGTFKCIKLSAEYKPLQTGGLAGYSETWFSISSGIIKNLQYSGDSVVLTTVLKEKNF
ncbi:MAG: hypothetical protein WCO93_11910 [bacterium]